MESLENYKTTWTNIIIKFLHPKLHESSDFRTEMPSLPLCHIRKLLLKASKFVMREISSVIRYILFNQYNGDDPAMFVKKFKIRICFASVTLSSTCSKTSLLFINTFSFLYTKYKVKYE